MAVESREMKFCRTRNCSVVVVNLKGEDPFGDLGVSGG